MIFLQLNCFTKLEFMQRECSMKSADNTEFYYLMDFPGGPAVGRLPASEWHPWVQSLVQDGSKQQGSGACLHWACTREPPLLNSACLRVSALQQGVGRREWSPIPVVLPGEFHRSRSLAGRSQWDHRAGHDWVTLSHFHKIYNHIYQFSQSRVTNPFC